jgi:hypothetical protein
MMNSARRFYNFTDSPVRAWQLLQRCETQQKQSIQVCTQLLKFVL